VRQTVGAVYDRANIFCHGFDKDESQRKDAQHRIAVRNPLDSF